MAWTVQQSASDPPDQQQLQFDVGPHRRQQDAPAEWQPAKPRPSLARTTSTASVNSVSSADSSTFPSASSYYNRSADSAYAPKHKRHHMDVTTSFTDQLHAVNLNDPQQQYAASPPIPEVPAKAVHEAMNFARSFPLLHATEKNQQQRRQRELNQGAQGSFISGSLPTQDAREKLFRTMGKWLDGTGSGNNTANNSRSSIASSTGSTTGASEDGFLQHIPRKHTNDLENLPPPPIHVTISMTASLESSSLAGNSHVHTTSPVQANAYTAPQPPRVHVQDPIFDAPKPASYMGIPHAVLFDTTNSNVSSPSNSVSGLSVSSESRPRSPPFNPAASTSHSKKRQRNTPAPSLAKALLTGCGAKRCSVDDCGKIAVSKGLCRGHGGGRRCQFTGCTKCAQSRSPYCWAHGGGKRCEAPNCRRSRKTKHFCVDHVDMEATMAPPTAASAAGLDESMDRPPATVTSKDLALTSSTTTTSTTFVKYSASTDLQQATPSESVSAAARLALSLPSLNDALKRSFPAPGAAPPSSSSSSIFRGVRQQERGYEQAQKIVFVRPFEAVSMVNSEESHSPKRHHDQAQAKQTKTRVAFHS
uniref:WRKY19-like zinc finger domain-containing protein n=1 Tax=Globisporangium ultimum (strain ATCC 200006 / CBS 805.95 / DAOM BR144) TaxID=431595 RepID=K3WJL5_GLOUD